MADEALRLVHSQSTIAEHSTRNYKEEVIVKDFAPVCDIFNFVYPKGLKNIENAISCMWRDIV